MSGSYIITDMEKPGNSIVPFAHSHDGFFKAVFSQPEHASAFFKSHLPPAIVARIDWLSFSLMPGSFVKSSLQQLHSDLLFSCRIDGRETRLYLLFEHQSTPDPAIRLRAILQLMKLAREKELLRFFQWLASYSAEELPDSLLAIMLHHIA